MFQQWPNDLWVVSFQDEPGQTDRQAAIDWRISCPSPTLERNQHLNTGFTEYSIDNLIAHYTITCKLVSVISDELCLNLFCLNNKITGYGI